MTRFMWFSPASSETLSSATIPPKRRLTFSTSSRATATARSTLRPSRNEGHWLDRSFQTGVWAQLTRPDGRRRRVGALAAVRRAALVLVLALAVPSAARTSLPGQEGGNRSTLQALARAAAPLYCGGRHGRYVALTFDDGPGPYTARLLQILARAGARATFFDIGSRVAAWPGLVREEVRRGAVGNHTWSHTRLASLGRRVVIRELLRTQAAIVRAAGGMRPLLFRPPYGVGTPAEAAALHALGLVAGCWSVDSPAALAGSTATSIVRTV